MMFFSDCKRQGQLNGMCSKHHQQKGGRRQINYVIFLIVQQKPDQFAVECT